MANFLDILAMGLQGAGSASAEDAPIAVTGKPLTVREIPKDTRSVKPVSRKQEQQDETPELIKRKGRFGVGGTLRDILGTLGDAYLMANGKPGTYGAQRDKEKVASAQYGFTNDPNAAAERVGELDADAARDLYKTAGTLENQKRNVESQEAVRSDQIANRQRDDVRAVTQRLSNMMNAAKTAQGRAGVVARAQYEADRLGVPLEAMGLSPDIDEEQAGIYASGGINRSQQENIPIAKQNADSRRISATKPPAPKSRPNPTAASMIAPIVDKIKAGKPLTPGEQKAYNDLKPSRGKASKIAIPPIDPNIFKK